MKKCCRCKETLPLESFGKNKTKKDGYQTACKECKKLYGKERYSEKREYILEVNQKWVDKNPEKRKQIRKRYYDNNSEACRERSSKWARENKDKRREMWQDWYNSNLDYCRDRSAKRRAAKNNATPEWLTQEHLSEIKSFYTQARDCELVSGEKYHVDHIVPLRGETVCGLHVPWNLQVLPADINIAKKNHFTEDSDNATLPYSRENHRRNH
jgi:hypothetical protein